MRIISGKYKGRIIQMPKGIRPTQGLVRKALFDILGDVEGLSFLELFAGSGAVGLEAASGGAKEVVFVDKDRRCLQTIKGNISAAPQSRYLFLLLDVYRAIEQLNKEKKKFDIIFLDPPYYHELAKKTLLNLSTYDILAPNGFIVAQHFKKDNLPEAVGDLALFRQARYGDTVLSFYKRRLSKDRLMLSEVIRCRIKAASDNIR
jgi:16S rRNA (guanine(966)-N(2))-methyltransferase RsmD